jgi:hypothetical protein
MNLKKYLGYTIAVVFLIGVFYVVFNSKEKSVYSNIDSAPAYIKEGENGNLSQVVLTKRAIDNLDLQTMIVTKDKKTIPYSAILYDINGKTWVYTNLESMIFIRKEVFIAGVVGSEVILSEPLLNNTAIVTVGALELFGVEEGIGQGGTGH